MSSDVTTQNLFSLDGQVIVITGACGLLGRKHANAVAAFGGTPILLDVNFQALSELVGQIKSEHGIEAHGYKVDITKEEQVADNARQLVSQFGKISGLVNNAANNPKMENVGGQDFSRLEHFPLDVWQHDIAVGLTGAMLCCKHHGLAISQNPDGGSIVNIASDLGVIAPDQRLYANPELPAEQQPVKPVTYSVVKSGLIGLTRYMATYWAEQGVRVNAMCPGGVENGQPEAFIKKVSSRIPMARMAQVNEYQGTLVWMLSDASSYLTGAIIPVDGGRSVW